MLQKKKAEKGKKQKHVIYFHTDFLYICQSIDKIAKNSKRIQKSKRSFILDSLKGINEGIF